MDGAKYFEEEVVQTSHSDSSAAKHGVWGLPQKFLGPCPLERWKIHPLKTEYSLFSRTRNSTGLWTSPFSC